MAEEVVEVVASQTGQFESIAQLITSSASLQIALIVFIVGIIAITAGYRKFSKWIAKQKFSYSRPHASRFVRVAILPFFAIALISSTNTYIQTFELFENQPELIEDSTAIFTPQKTFAKILNTINILVIGYTIGHLIPIIFTKREKSVQERADYEAWKEMRGFPDGDSDFFHKLFKWIPPTKSPDEISDEEFQKMLKTKEGRTYLENFHTAKGLPIGGFEPIVKDPFAEWKKIERAKYEKYYNSCYSGKNESGKKLKPGLEPEEIYQIDVWREERRLGGYQRIIPGARPPGYAARKRKDLPKSVSQIIPIGIFVAVIIGVISWWGVDLIVLATATGGIALGVGLAMQETMQNWFAYIMIRKDKIFVEGDRVKLDTGYNGYVHKINPRVTFVRDALNESIAVIPTRQLVNAQIINYTKESKMVPAQVDVGVSYLNDPRQVAGILVKVGKRALKEVVDGKGQHLAIQTKCPYLDENKPSCGCDKDLHIDISQPVVRFNLNPIIGNDNKFSFEYIPKVKTSINFF